MIDHAKDYWTEVMTDLQIVITGPTEIGTTEATSTEATSIEAWSENEVESAVRSGALPENGLSGRVSVRQASLAFQSCCSMKTSSAIFRQDMRVRGHLVEKMEAKVAKAQVFMLQPERTGLGLDQFAIHACVDALGDL